MAYVDPTVACGPWTTVDKMCCAGDQEGVDCDGAPVSPAFSWTDDELLSAATNLLFRRTCYRYPGVCTRTIWPCLHCGGCGCHPCGCGPYHAIELTSDYPILDITEIKVNGVVLDPVTYRLDENARIVRMDGEMWPTCNNLGVPDPPGNSDEMTIEYTTGRMPPIELQIAAAELACELKKACSGSTDCKLPVHVKSVARRGVEYDVKDVISLISVGLTGNPIIDHALAIHGNCRRARMFDPLHDHHSQVRKS